MIMIISVGFSSEIKDQKRFKNRLVDLDLDHVHLRVALLVVGGVDEDLVKDLEKNQNI